MNRISMMIRKHPLATFFSLALGLTWAIGAVLAGTPILAPDGNFIAGLLIASFIVVGATSGRTGFADLGRRMFRWRVAPRWYAVVFVLPVLIVGATVGLLSVFGSAPLDWTEAPSLVQVAMFFGLLLVLPVGAPVAEEIAWRGVALPALLRRRSALTASILLGVIWSIWHLPVVLATPELRVPVPFLLAVIPLSVLTSWIFANTRGSVLVAIVFHAWFDVTALFGFSLVNPADAALAWWLLGGIQALLAVAIVSFYGRELQRAPSFAVPASAPAAVPAS